MSKTNLTDIDGGVEALSIAHEIGTILGEDKVASVVERLLEDVLYALQFSDISEQAKQIKKRLFLRRLGLRIKGTEIAKYPFEEDLYQDSFDSVWDGLIICSIKDRKDEERYSKMPEPPP